MYTRNPYYPNQVTKYSLSPEVVDFRNQWIVGGEHETFNYCKMERWNIEGCRDD